MSDVSSAPEVHTEPDFFNFIWDIFGGAAQMGTQDLIVGSAVDMANLPTSLATAGNSLAQKK